MSSHLTQNGRSIYGRGKPTGDYTGISADEIINNPEEALKKHKSISEGVIENTNQKIIEFNKINNSFGAAFKNDTLRKLSNQIDSDIASIRSITDYKAAKTNWTRYIHQLSTDPVSGKVSPEISAFISNATRMIDRTGITVGIDEASKKSIGVLQRSFSDVSLSLNDGDLGKANNSYRQTLGMLNEFEAIGSIDKGLVKSIRRTYQRKFNDRSMAAIQNSTFTIFNTSGYGAAEKYLKKVKGMVNLSKGSLPKQRAYTKFLSLFKKMPNTAILKTYDKAMDNWVKYGAGNPRNLIQDAGKNIARLEAMKKVGSNNEGITAAQNDIKAFEKLVTAHGDIFTKGGNSRFSPLLLEGLNSRNINEVISELKITDPNVIDAVAKMNTTFMRRIEKESGGDPVKKVSIIDNMFKKNTGTQELKKPQDIFENIAHEKEMSRKYYGDELLSEETKDNIINEITEGDPSPEGEAYKQSILDTVGKNTKVQAGLLRASNGNFNTDLQHIASKHGQVFSSIFPTPGNVQIIRSLYKREGFRPALNNVRKVAFANSDIHKVANMIGVSRENLAHNIGLDVAVRSSRGLPGELTYTQISNNLKGEKINTRIEAAVKKRLDDLQAKFYTSNEGNFSIQNESVLGESLRDFDENIGGFGYNVAKTVNKEQFHAGKAIHDLFSSEEFIADNKTKDARINFYNLLSGITGLPPESFVDRLTLKQHEDGSDYYLTFPTQYKEGFHNVRSTVAGITKNKFKISEDSMSMALGITDRDKLTKFLIGAMINDSER